MIFKGASNPGFLVFAECKFCDHSCVCPPCATTDERAVVVDTRYSPCHQVHRPFVFPCPVQPIGRDILRVCRCGNDKQSNHYCCGHAVTSFHRKTPFLRLWIHVLNPQHQGLHG